MAEFKTPAPPHDEDTQLFGTTLPAKSTNASKTALRWKLEDAPTNNATGASSSKTDTPKSDAPSEDAAEGNIYQTLLSVESSPHCNNSTTSMIKRRRHNQVRTLPPVIPPPTPISTTLPSSSSTTKRKGSKSKQSRASMKIFAIKETKAERLQECMKYFPKAPFAEAESSRFSWLWWELLTELRGKDLKVTLGR
ncbi:hypothetical protein GE21DRAFT_1334723 [Neurospora crassa]|nr:hypothetical protein GE21DRAFT_1334723 [Neurospora crassa]